MISTKLIPKLNQTYSTNLTNLIKGRLELRISELGIF